MTHVIAVIEAGEVPEDLVEAHHDYPQQVANWLRDAMPATRFEALRLVRQEPLPPPDAYDGYVISGSKHGAYDPLPWIKPLERFIRACGERQIPVFGICFGHQVMAQAYGAPVRKSARGWGVGTQGYQLDAAGFAAEPTPVYVFHQDQVEGVPEGAEAIGGNEFCPIGALRYATAACSVQFHPEFRHPYIESLLHTRRGVTLPETIADAALDSLATRPDNGAIARWVGEFFASHLGRHRAAPSATSA